MMNGIKQISPDNWLTVDPAMSGVYMPGASDDAGRNWVDFILEPQLNSSVPQEVRTLYEVARGTIVYSVFYYPLMVIGAEQMLRVAETAARAKCRQLAPKRRPEMLKGSVTWLTEMGVITSEDLPAWEAIRQLRNAASHPGAQQIYSVGMMRHQVDAVVTCVNRLFG